MNPRRFLILLVLVLFTVVSGLGYLDPAVNSVGLDSIHKANSDYLQDSFDKSLKGFLVLSAIKSGVAVIEGSTVGVGFGLQVGDVVQPIYNYVDVAWRTVLAGGVILLLMRLVLETLYAINHWVLCGAFSIAVYILTKMLLSALLGASRNQTMRDELELILSKYLQPRHGIHALLSRPGWGAGYSELTIVQFQSTRHPSRGA